MPFVTELKNWYIVYIILFFWLFWKGGKNGRIAALVLILTIVITDQINSMVLKELFGRPRPCVTLDNINLLVSCGAGKSFPSSHAANSFAAATILSFFYRQYKFAYFTIALVISFSRVYVGVHYPADVIAGGLIGFLIALMIANIIKLYYRPIKPI
ncbi:MAG: phosphatase PAP2 family protein [bacterium]